MVARRYQHLDTWVRPSRTNGSRCSGGTLDALGACRSLSREQIPRLDQCRRDVLVLDDGDIALAVAGHYRTCSTAYGGVPDPTVVSDRNIGARKNPFLGVSRTRR
jgi:hypothetical protein